MVDTSYSRAANAYQNNLRMMQGMQDDASAPETSGAKGGASFMDMLEDTVGSAIDSQYKAEAAKVDALSGKVDLADLVTAVSNAELTLNTVVAVRDRVISAYQDIIRMPI